MRFITRLSLPRILAVLLAAACWMQSANAGTKGSMINTFGRGVSVNTVVYNGGTNTARSPLTQNPSSAVYDFDYGLEGVDPYDTSVTQTGLPIGTPKEIYSRSLGTAPGVWTWDAFVMDGATADNPALTAKLPIVPAGLASYNVRFTNFVDGANKIGGVRLEGSATKGAGVWLRVIEFTGVGEPIDIDDLVAHGDLKLEVTLAGPFSFNQADCTDVKIPFTFKRTTNDVYFVADGVALSIPFTVSSPDLPGQCGMPVIYPSAAVSGGSGTNTVSYSPGQGTTFGYGVHTVTVIAEDAYLSRTNKAGVRFPLKTTNSFKVTVTDTIPPVITCPAPIVQRTDLGLCSASVTVVPAVATDNCGAAVGGVRSDNLPLTAAYPKGITTITWTATDAAGNSTTCTQTITVVDTEKPVPNAFPATVTGDCGGAVSLPLLTALDNCSGTITGTITGPTTNRVFSAPGTYSVPWTFRDSSGNTAIVTQTVVVTGVQMIGPDSPISAANSNCSTPFSIKRRNVVPFKFDLKCGDNFITTGPGPTVVIQKFSDCNTSSSNATTDVSTYYQNAWHYNWSTPNTTGLYKVTFTLNNVALKSVWVTVTN